MTYESGTFEVATGMQASQYGQQIAAGEFPFLPAHIRTLRDVAEFSDGLPLGFAHHVDSLRQAQVLNPNVFTNLAIEERAALEQLGVEVEG